MSDLTPQEAILALKARDPARWTDKAIADEVGYSQPGINRLATGVRADPPWSYGQRIIALAEREGCGKKKR